MKKLLFNKKGNSAIILLVFMTLIMGVSALTIDAGMIFFEKSKLQSAVDAAALAGMAKFEAGEADMVNEAYRMAGLNGLAASNIVITVSDNGHKITVNGTKEVPFYFAKAFNLTSSIVKAKAVAAATPITSADGVRPLAVENQNFVFGQTYTIKKGADGGYCGNYGALALGGSGASNYRNNLEHGYHADIKIGDWVEIGEDVETEPGNMAGPTYDGISYILHQDINTNHNLSNLEPNCPRLIVIPIVDSLEVNGRTSVKVMGFAAFFLEDVTYEGGKTEIRGEFVKKVGQGEMNINGINYGLNGVKLVE